MKSFLAHLVVHGCRAVCYVLDLGLLGVYFYGVHLWFVPGSFEIKDPLMAASIAVSILGTVGLLGALIFPLVKLYDWAKNYID